MSAPGTSCAPASRRPAPTPTADATTRAIRLAGVRTISQSAYTARTSPPSRIGSAAPDSPMSPIEPASSATQGTAECPSGRWAMRSSATKAHGSQAAACTTSMCSDCTAMKPPYVNDTAPRLAAVQLRPSTRSSTSVPTPAATSTTAWFTTQASAPGRMANNHVVG